MGKDTSFHDGALAGVLLSPLKLAFALGMALMGILLVAWIIDWVFVSRVWPGCATCSQMISDTA